MSAGQRARARAAREAARAQEREQAARTRRPRPAAKPRRTAPRRRPQRYGAMPVRTRLGLALGWLLVQFVGWQLLAAPAQRLGLALLSLLALPLVITLYFSPRSSR